MTFISLSRVIKTSLVSLWRNRWLALASTFIMVITLIIISLFVTLSIITNKLTESLKNKIDMIAYIEDNTTTDQIFSLQKVLLSRPDISSVNYVSKEEALVRWQDRNRDNEKIRDIVSADNNPLPRSLEIKTKNPEDLETIAKFLESQNYSPLIKELSYRKNKDLIDRLVRITSFVKIFGWGFSTIFILISILIIYNTIRLTIFARSEEIEIMKLVGATDWYVRGPFIIDGLMYGVFATVIASIVIYFSFKLTLPWAQNYLGEFNLGTGYLGVSFFWVVMLQLLVGILLGTTCSLIAVKKYLK